jgi:alkaline phosphatase D
MDGEEAFMTIEIPRKTLRVSRRRFLSTAAATGVSLVATPYLSRAADRPAVTHGVQSGDVGADGGVIWSRADRPSQMMVDISTTESFKDARALPPINALPESDFTAKMLVENLPGGQDIFYRVRFRDLSHVEIMSEPIVGRFRTAPSDKRDVSFVWGGDVAGQGWGINPDDGGMFTFSAMKKHRPDFFLHSGDTIYADGLIPSEVKLADGKVWKNVTIPEKAKVAETLDEFRAAHKYNFLDENVRAFNAEVPIFVQWDDHEVTNNWSLSKDLPAAYKERNISLLAARLPRHVSDAREHRRAGPGLPHAELRSASRRLHARRAQLSRSQRCEPAGEIRPRRVLPRAGADAVAEARAAQFARDLEGDRLRHAAVADRL